MKIIRAKKALVTGAASGIGRAIALALAREGADLYLLDIDAAGLATTADEARTCGVEVVGRTCDLREAAQISAAVRALLEHWGTLDILVNNAGLLYRGPMHEMSDAQWDALLAVNLLAPIQLVRELLPALRGHEAHIVNVCSIFGLITSRKATAYQTSKFGLVGFSAGLRVEYAGRDFAVTTLCPGFVNTALLEGFTARDPHKAPPAIFCTTPEKVAAKTIAAIRHRRNIVVVTPLAKLMWFGSRMLPNFVEWLFRRGWRRK